MFHGGVGPVSVGSVKDTRDISVGRDELYELASAVLGRGASFSFVANGVSMLPFVHGGDRLTIAPCRAEELIRGEIAFYVGEGGGLMAHRVLGRSRDGVTLLTRGDAVWRVPERVPPSQVLGRVTRIQRGGRRRTLGLASRLTASVWHGLFPYPLRVYLRLARWRQARRGELSDGFSPAPDMAEPRIDHPSR
jgi:hypothetical protein